MSPAEPSSIPGRAGAVLDRRLRRDVAVPVAVAFSGGGDSLALLLLAAAWARDARRRLVVLSVDHGLQPQSAAWTEVCAARARSLDLPFRALAWRGPKAVGGLPAAARAARHDLLAQGAREAGARVILLGHTADDVIEARRMRAAGSSTPEPREWGPSPAWPAGRDLFLARPLLTVGRAEIRAWLAARGERWIEDPANEDLRFARARARRSSGPQADPAPLDPLLTQLAQSTVAEIHGGLSVARERVRAFPVETIARFVAMAALCAAGGTRPPAYTRAAALAARLQGRECFTATLAGARIQAEPDAARFLREAGEMARGGIEPLVLAAGEAGVWDGRFELVAEEAVEVVPLKGRMGRLDRDQRRRLSAIAAKARPGLPLVLTGGGASCPLLAASPAQARPLAHDRLLAACGVVQSEP